MMVKARLGQALRGQKPALVPYLMAGDPDLETTEMLVRALARNGAAAIELGVPYGDPLADGPTIQAAGQRALAGGIGLREVLALAQRLHDEIPIVLFTYFNPIYRYGAEAFARDAARAGVAGVIVPDLALEELDALRPVLAQNGVAMPLLIAPTTPARRAAEIAKRASGFVYIVSRLGVTGADAVPDMAPLRARIAALRVQTQLPLALGFGISTAEQVRSAASLVDAVIVGSALIDAYAGTRGEEAVSRVGGVMMSLGGSSWAR